MSHAQAARSLSPPESRDLPACAIKLKRTFPRFVQHEIVQCHFASHAKAGAARHCVGQPRKIRPDVVVEFSDDKITPVALNSSNHFQLGTSSQEHSVATAQLPRTVPVTRPRYGWLADAPCLGI